MDEGDADFLALVDALDKEDWNFTESFASTSDTPSQPIACVAPKVSDLEKRIKELEAELAAKTSSQPASSASAVIPSAAKAPKLFDLNFNIFTTPKSVPPSEQKQPEEKVTLSDIGLSDSSDDDEHPSSLSKSGRQIKRKLEHTEKEEKEARKQASAPARPRNSAFKSLSAPSSAAAQAASAKKKHAPPKTGTVVTCEFSGFKIVDPLLPAAEVGARLGDRRTCKLGQVVLLNSSFGKSDWATFGIVVQNLGTKTSAKGTQFSILKIVDLEDTTNVVTLFLFSGKLAELIVSEKLRKFL